MKQKAVLVTLLLIVASVVACSKKSEDINKGIFLYVHGGYLVGAGPEDMDNPPILTLAIFFSAKSKCPRCLSETEVYRRLLPLFNSPKYRIVAITSKADSAEIVDFLKKENLQIELRTPLVDFSFQEMGLFYSYMPLKVLYDSTLTAIYVRAADNSPESQNDFENHVIRLRNLFEDESVDQFEVKISVDTQ